MFKKKNALNEFTNLVAQGTTVSGTVSFTGTIKIQGNVEGDLITMTDANDLKKQDRIIVDDGGSVTSSEIRAYDIVIAGNVSSNKIYAEETVAVLSTAIIKNATIYYRTLEIESGAVLNNCELHHLDFTSAESGE